MFDKHVTQLPFNPVDAARLYGELLKLAREEIVSEIVHRCGASNEVKLVSIELIRDIPPDGQRRNARVIFTVNGVKYDMDADISLVGPEAVAIEAISSKLAEIVAEKLLELRVHGRL